MFAPNAPTSRSALLGQPEWRWWLGFVGLVLLLGIWIYHPVAQYGFLEFDDAVFIRPLNAFAGGLTARSAAWAFRANLTEYSPYAEYWCPLTLITRLADISVHGNNIGAYHITNLALHLLNTMLLALALRQLSGRLLPSFAVALLFLTHPLNAEPVCWLSARKDLLNAFFFFATLLAYGWYVRRQTRGRYALMLLAYIGCLLAKPMGITVPFILLILDGWPLRRFPMSTSKEVRAEQWRVLAEKLPLFLLAVPIAYLAVVSQQDWHSLVPTDRLPIWMRVTNAIVSYALYVRRLFWPSDLAIFYPHPMGTLSALKIGLSLAFLLAITAAVWLGRKRYPMFLAGWAWFVITLGPVCGLTQLGSYAMADRYVYLAALGPFMAVVWWMADHVRRAWQVAALSVAVTLATLVCIPQALSWRDDLTAFTRALAATEHNWMAHLNLGGLEFREGRKANAYAHMKTAVRMNPGWPTAWADLAEIEIVRGQDREAIRCLATALQLDPKNLRSMLLIGILEKKIGDEAKAEAAFRRLLQIAPADAPGNMELGNLLAEQGRWSEAAHAWTVYLKAHPEDQETSRRVSEARGKVE